MKKFNLLSCRTNAATLAVSSYQEGELRGWLLHPRLDSPKEVHSVPQLLFFIDDLLFREDHLISYHAFAPTGLEHIPRIATIQIQILFQEHHTWQGCLLWEDQQKEAPFRSVLELIQILDEILVD